MVHKSLNDLVSEYMKQLFTTVNSVNERYRQLQTTFISRQASYSWTVSNVSSVARNKLSMYLRETGSTNEFKSAYFKWYSRD